MSSRLVSRVVMVCMAMTGFMALADRTKAPVPTKVESFSLRDPRDDSEHRLAGEQKATVVVFLGTQCPINNDYLPELARLHKEYAPRGVRFLGINANRQDTPAEVAAHAKRAAVPFAVLKDPGAKIADRFGAKRTPEAFVLNPKGEIVYRGRIDDQFGIGYRRPGKPTRRDLVEALNDVLASKAVRVASTEVAGCYIGRPASVKAEGKVTFTRNVLPVLQRNCQECHRPGQIGPMSLTAYDDVVSWADTIREVVNEGRMPPWYADPKHGEWANDKRLNEKDKKTLLAWLDAGMPQGDDADAPAPRVFPEGWMIGKPDQIIPMPESFTVPAETPPGGVPYKNFVVDPGFKEDVWVQAAEARPGSPEVVHHILVFILPPTKKFLDPGAPDAVLCGMAPGDMPLMLQEGYAKKVPAGSKLIFQMHYTPNGKEQKDRSSIGLVFAKKKPTHRVFTFPVHNELFRVRLLGIPAGAENFEMTANHTIRRDAELLAFMPHMHLRGKSFRYELHHNGKKEVLLNVPQYNFNWQSVYRPKKPITLPAGAKIHCVAHFDNSAKNPNNPDPSKRILWGDQTWEEMMVGWYDYAEKLP